MLMKIEDRMYLEFFIFWGFILANCLVLLIYGIWFDPRLFVLRMRLAEGPDMPFYFWFGPYFAHVLVRLGVFLWGRKRPKPGTAH